MMTDEVLEKAIGHLKAALDWIDSVPDETPLPAMPGFDRDEVDEFIERHTRRHDP